MPAERECLVVPNTLVTIVETYDCGESLDQWKDLASRSIVPSLRFGMFDSFEALLRKAPWI